MEVRFTTLSVARQAVGNTRDDGSSEQLEPDSRSFLNRDIAHLAVEAELELEHGFWGSVAADAGLAGVGPGGDEIRLAERLAGPVQSLLRVEAGPAEIQATVRPLRPTSSSTGTVRASTSAFDGGAASGGATPIRGEMVVSWPLDPVDRTAREASE